MMPWQCRHNLLTKKSDLHSSPVHFVVQMGRKNWSAMSAPSPEIPMRYGVGSGCIDFCCAACFTPLKTER
jgi:hypothetical protein